MPDTKERKPKAPRIGNRQHAFLYGGPNCWDSVPYRFKAVQGQPPPVLRKLIEKGLMWAQRRDRRNWQPRRGKWGPQEPGPEHWCGLTPAGRKLIEDRKNALYPNLSKDGQ